MTDHRSALDDSPNPIVSYRLDGLADRVLDAEPPLVDSGKDSIDRDTVDGLANGIEDAVPLVHRDFEQAILDREEFGKDLEVPKEVSPERTAPPMAAAPPHSPLNADAFEHLLHDHPNRPWVQWLVTSIREGFYNYSDMPETDQAVYGPMQSALEWKAEVSEWLQTEVAAGRMLRFADKPHPFAVASPVGEAPKHGGKHRVIHNLSKRGRDLRGNIIDSVNDCIPPSDFSCRYMVVQELVASLNLLRQHGGTEWAACGIVRGFRNMPLHPSCYHLHTLVWEGEWYVDVAVGFGSRRAPFSFSSISAAAAWVIQRRLTARFGLLPVTTAQGVEAMLPTANLSFLMDGFAATANSNIAEPAEQVMALTMAELGPPLQREKDKAHGPDGKYLGGGSMHQNPVKSPSHRTKQSGTGPSCSALHHPPQQPSVQ